ncbi:DUF4124 domain-containing protein [Psychromonas antarctica]|uniref:DUF4124 domain-containing protein n=1 Tax=Psychromonas antarctica TaxID=67573 RepID=UPI003B82FDB5
MPLRSVSILIMLTSLYIVTGHAEIYKFQDESGKWHFTDVAPTGNTLAVQLDIDKTQTASEKSHKKTGQNLQTYLSDLIKPNAMRDFKHKSHVQVAVVCF